MSLFNLLSLVMACLVGNKTALRLAVQPVTSETMRQVESWSYVLSAISTPLHRSDTGIASEHNQILAICDARVGKSTLVGLRCRGYD